MYERQAGMVALKEEEERASQERMADLLEAERIRQDALRLARASQRRRDEQLYVMAAVALVVFVIIVVLLVLLTSN